MRDTDLYKEDWIGLRELDESGRLILSDAPGPHMRFSLDWFLKHVINPYLRGPDTAGSEQSLTMGDFRQTGAASA